MHTLRITRATLVLITLALALVLGLTGAAAVALTNRATPPAADVPPRPSAMAWDSGTNSHDAGRNANFAKVRNRAIDVIGVSPTRDSWEEVLNPWWMSESAIPTDFKGTLSVAPPLFPENGSLAAAAAGEYNAQWEQLGRLIATKYPTAYVRPGWEFNIHNWKWSANPQNVDQWKAAFQNAATHLKKGGPQLRIVWNPNEGRGDTLPNAEDAWPGDAYVDIVGIDAYDWDPPYTGNGWTTHKTQNQGWDHWLNFTKAHGKKFALPEWGVMPGSGNNGGDNPEYVKNVLGWLKANASYVAYDAYFDEPAAYCKCDLTQNPQASAAYVAAVSRLGTGLPGTLTDDCPGCDRLPAIAGTPTAAPSQSPGAASTAAPQRAPGARAASPQGATTASPTPSTSISWLPPSVAIPTPPKNFSIGNLLFGKRRVSNFDLDAYHIIFTSEPLGSVFGTEIPNLFEQGIATITNLLWRLYVIITYAIFWLLGVLVFSFLLPVTFIETVLDWDVALHAQFTLALKIPALVGAVAMLNLAYIYARRNYPDLAKNLILVFGLMAVATVGIPAEFWRYQINAAAVGTAAILYALTLDNPQAIPQIAPINGARVNTSPATNAYDSYLGKLFEQIIAKPCEWLTFGGQLPPECSDLYRAALARHLPHDDPQNFATLVAAPRCQQYVAAAMNPTPDRMLVALLLVIVAFAWAYAYARIVLPSLKGQFDYLRTILLHRLILLAASIPAFRTPALRYLITGMLGIYITMLVAFQFLLILLFTTILGNGLPATVPLFWHIALMALVPFGVLVGYAAAEKNAQHVIRSEFGHSNLQDSKHTAARTVARQVRSRVVHPAARRARSFARFATRPARTFVRKRVSAATARARRLTVGDRTHAGLLLGPSGPSSRDRRTTTAPKPRPRRRTPDTTASKTPSSQPSRPKRPTARKNVPLPRRLATSYVARAGRATDRAAAHATARATVATARGLAHGTVATARALRPTTPPDPRVSAATARDRRTPTHRPVPDGASTEPQHAPHESRVPSAPRDREAAPATPPAPHEIPERPSRRAARRAGADSPAQVHEREYSAPHVRQ